MSEVGKYGVLAGTAGTGRRAHAVAAALEVIAARAASPSPTDLGSEFNNLKKYADQIQEALKG